MKWPHRVAAAQSQLDRTKRVVERVWQAVQAEHFFPAPSQMNCPGCPIVNHAANGQIEIVPRCARRTHRPKRFLRLPQVTVERKY